MKNKLQILSVVITVLCLLNSVASAQSPWNLEGNRATDTSYIGSNNYKDLIFKTDSTERMSISKDGDVHIDNNLFVPNGLIKTDSINARVITADSIKMDSGIIVAKYIHAEVIKAGDSSIVTGTGQFPPTVFHDIVGTTLTTRSIDMGHVTMSGATITGLNGNFPGVNIGSTTTAGFKLHLHDDYSAGNAYVQFTNSIPGGPATGQTVNDGFRIGITSNPSAALNGIANIFQGGAKPINFFTNGTFKMTILGNATSTDGFVGINTNDPTRRVEITDNANVPQFRITHNDANGRWVDFQTTPLGDLYINPHSNSNPTQRGVGIGTSIPGAELEVFKGSIYPHLRLTQFSPTLPYAPVDGVFSDIRTTSSGNLNIFPTHLGYESVGSGGAYYDELGIVQIGFPGLSTFPLLANPNLVLDVNGQTNLRTVNLDLTGLLNKVLVIDPTNNGRVLYRDIPIDIVGSCPSPSPIIDYLTKWSSTGPNKICNSIVNEDGQGIGVGTPAVGNWGIIRVVNNSNSYNAIDVYSTTHSGSFSTKAINAWASENAPSGARNTAISGGANGNVQWENIGIHGNANNSASSNMGIYGTAGNSGSNPNSSNMGVFGFVAPSTAGAFLAGVSGSAPSQSNSWAGWFSGYGYIPGGVWQASDSILKTGILPISNSLQIIRGITPRQYYFDTASYSFMNFPTELQYGFIAEELDTITPNLVKSAFQPQGFDTTGSMIHDSLSFSTINQGEIIPILVGAVKQLDSTLISRPYKTQNAIWIDTLNRYEWGTNSLLHNTKIPMIDDSLNEWNIYFTGQSQMQTGNPADVGIGIISDSILKGKLDVLNLSSTESESYNYTNLYAGRFNNTGFGFGTTEHWGHVTDIVGEQFAAVYGKSIVKEDEETPAFMNIGGDFSAGNGTINVGVRNIVGFKKTPGSLINVGELSIVGNSNVAIGTYSMAVGGITGTVGVYGSGYNGADYNYGVWGQTAFEHDSTSGAGVANYAVYGELGDSGATTPDFAGYFNGDLGTTAGFYQVSDSKFKKDIKTFGGTTAMDILNQLQPKTYSFDNRKFKSMALPFGSQYGLLSDDVEKIIPGLTKNAVQAPKTDQYGKIIIPSIEYKALNYTGLIPILVAGVKEIDSTNDAQQLQNEALENQVNTLQQQLDELKLQMQQISDCCHQQTGTNNPTGMNTGGVNQTVVELNNYAIILDQNSPNPFAEQTTITFKIPVDVKDAKILFSDDRGSVIKTVQITTRGDGSLLVYASNLSSGIYTYSLLADDKLIDTKKMIIATK